MVSRKRKDRGTIRRLVLTLRLTEEEMLRFKVAALRLKTKRSKLVRSRVADLIGEEVEPAMATGREVPVGALATG